MSSYSNVIRLNRPESQDPIAVLEIIASENKWPLEKHADDEVSFDCIGRWGELHEIGALALYLASPAASYVTGAAFTVDGGWTAQ